MIYNRLNSKFCGIYKIKNVKNNKFYIGSVTTKFSIRKAQHFSLLRRNLHYNRHLQRAVNKYGIDKFLFEIVEICSPVNCILREQYFVNKLHPDYNMCVVEVSSRLGVTGRVQSKEERRKRSKILKKHYRNNPKALSIIEMKKLITLRSEGVSIKGLLELFDIGTTTLENILYSKKYRKFNSLEEHYVKKINYKKLYKNQYMT